MGGGNEIPNFMSGAQDGGGQPDGMSQLQEAIGALSQNQKQLGGAHAVTQQAIMFLANIMINETLDKPDHVKEAYLKALGRILQGENPQKVQEELRKDLTNPGIITP